MRRGVPVPTAPLFNTLVMRPKLEAAEILDAGLAKIGWFKRLNASARNFTLAFPPMEVTFSIAQSVSQYPGPRATLRPKLPQVPFAGTAKAAGLNQLLSVCSAG